MSETALQAIRESPIFCGLAEEDLRELVDGGRQESVDAGTCLIAEGDPGDSLIVLLDGEMEVVRDTGDGEASLAKFGPGAFVGEMALIDEGPRTATVRATAPSEILVITKAQFDRLLDQSPEACRALIRTILRRLKSTEGMLVNQEKMAALGRISAGLAHELNNPASAVSRSARQLQSLVDEWQTATLNLGQTGSSSELVERTSVLRAELAAGPTGDTVPKSALERADREDSLTDWLEDKGVPDAWDAAANLAAAGYTPERLDQISAGIAADEVVPIMQWLSSGSAIYLMLTEMHTSAERLSEIVSAVKRYSHMDRAQVERININSGIESTLVILKHKMKNVEVIRDLDPKLVEIEGYPAELNQVWTNLIDNAVDAMDGTGVLRISTRAENGHVIAEFTDSGVGISKEHMRRLFEPFFTTKEIGSGTGLGLHIAHNIVVQRHGGQVDVESEPGRTTFRVSLPVR
jgi:signal transduction histidine kinase